MHACCRRKSGPRRHHPCKGPASIRGGPDGRSRGRTWACAPGGPATATTCQSHSQCSAGVREEALTSRCPAAPSLSTSTSDNHVRVRGAWSQSPKGEKGRGRHVGAPRRCSEPGWALRAPDVLSPLLGSLPVTHSPAQPGLRAPTAPPAGAGPPGPPGLGPPPGRPLRRAEPPQQRPRSGRSVRLPRRCPLGPDQQQDGDQPRGRGPGVIVTGRGEEPASRPQGSTNQQPALPRCFAWIGRRGWQSEPASRRPPHERLGT